MPWAVGEGGFGTLDTLPREIRQIIYGYVLDVDRPVKIKACCGPDTTTRERNACRKHNTNSGKFNVLQMSKAINDEASWVLYSKGSLQIEVHHPVTPYLDGHLKSLRHLGKSITQNKRKMTLWAVAARFRFVNIRVPESNLRYGDPAKFTGQLLEIACLLSNAWESIQPVMTPTNFVQLDLGTLFHQMLPFNMESQAQDKYGELLDWLSINYPCAEPDFDQIAAEAEQNLKKLASVVGMHLGRSQWKFVATTDLDEKDEGGADALRAFQVSCARNGVEFEHRE